jgi:lysyl endopeptidase
MGSRCVGAMLCLLWAAAAWAQAVAVPPASNRAAPPAKAANITLILPAGAPQFVIELPPPSAAEQASVQNRASAVAGGPALSAKRQVRAIGFTRRVPGGERSLTLAALPWQTVGDGGKAAQVVVRSPGAAAIRLGLSMPLPTAGVTLRFADDARVYGPYSAASLAQTRTYWSPVLDGSSATLEIYLPAGVAPEKVDLRMSKISHLVTTVALLAKSEPTQDIGRSGFCEVDVACVATPALTSQARSVAKLLYTDAAGTFICTGTLVNDSTASNTPYLYTASHCLDSQEAASSLVTYWAFDAVSCGSRAVPPYVTLGGGAKLLGRSVDADWALVRLNSPPPANAVFSAWRADPLPDGSNITVAHHPAGDLKKVTEGTKPGAYSFSDGTTFSSARYTMGSTEPGSSGAGLLTLANGGAFYELRGGLFAGNGSCAQPDGIDVYSRLDQALPLLASYLSPGTPDPSKKTLVVEYYYAGFDDYFITADPNEIQGLDSGAHPGWVRTGLSFLAYSDPGVAPAGAQPVCRFYLLPQYGDSHFYSADRLECAATAAKFAGSWVEESTALFYIQIPDRTTGACPANTRPVYRFMNQTNQIHHRYTAEVDVRNCMYYGANPASDKDVDCSTYGGPWTEEGYGTAPDAPVMCSPAS